MYLAETLKSRWSMTSLVFLSMRVTDEVRVEVEHVGALDAAAVASPRVRVAVKAAVKEVESLIGKRDVAMLALPVGIDLGHFVVVVVLAAVVVLS